MGIAIAIIVVVIIAVGVGVSLGLRRRRLAAATAPPTPRAPRPDPAPMTGLEDALSKVTDRSGTSMRDRLDAESGHVDELRVDEDTGPLLRRALDHVKPTDQAAGAPEPVDGTATAATTDPEVATDEGPGAAT